MTTERLVRMFAGLFVLVSLSLGVDASPVFVSHGWLWFTTFVGFMLLQSSFTGFCPLEMILRAAGVKSGTSSVEQ